MTITRGDATEALYSVFDNDEDLISRGALYRNGEVLDYEICEMEISGSVEIKRDGKVQRDVHRGRCHVCSGRSTQMIPDYGEAAADPLTTEYVIENAPFFLDSSFVIPVQHEINKCTNCSGTGSVPCSGCRGSGDKRCHKCDGKGEKERRKKCEVCGGKTSSKCAQCEGTGHIYLLELCHNCHGDGSEDCYDCHGNGKKDCTPCDGSGEKHLYSGYYRLIKVNWEIDGLPSFWTANEGPLAGETIARFEWDDQMFEATLQNDSFLTMTGTNADAGAFNLKYGDEEYHAMVIDNGTSRNVVFDPATGPIKTSFGRRFHDLRSRFKHRLFRR